MSAALAVLSAVAALGGLPQLPERGLALDTKAGVQLQTMGGKPIATLPGLDLASDKTVAHNLTMRDRRGRIFILERDGRVRRVDEGRPEYPGCRVNDARRTLLLLVCRRAIKIVDVDGRFQVVARAPTRYPAGHWERATWAPGGDAVLAQWIAECEVPVAYLVAEGRLTRYGNETVALGWLAPRVAVIHFMSGGCGGSGARGIYAVALDGKRRLLLRTPRFASYLMFGG